MKIEFQGEFKSLKNFISDDLDPFSIITGKNGCGKSQLIELIRLKASNQLTPLVNIEFQPAISKIQIEGIENSNLIALNNLSWRSKVDQHISQFNQSGRNLKLLYEALIRSETWFTGQNQNFFIESIITIPAVQVEELVTDSLKEIEPKFFQHVRPFDQIQGRLLEHGIFSENRRQACLVAMYVADYRNKALIELSDSDFFLTPIPEHFLDEPKLFGSQLEYVFYNYAKRRDQNQRFFFEKNTYGDKNDSSSDEEFIKQFPPPWAKVNEILAHHKLEFQFKGIERKDFSPDATITFQLVKTTIGKDIEFQNLSSGEKVIIGLIIKLFTSQYYNERLEFPELIVLDEPDAHLHPEMSKLLIDVLNETFVKKLGIRVIIITHSPSTVALSPDNSIYQLKNEPEASLEKIEKDNALKLLTGFIPTLSIDYKNHKQVFVESPTDINYYQMIFNKLNQERNYPFKLYFISNALGKGNCDQVRKIVRDLRESGNLTSFGIIDWDLENSSGGYVKVHGLEKRYSVENYLYDPIYLAVLFMNLKAHGIYGELGVDETINQYSIGDKPDEFLQGIVDWFFSKYYEKYTISEDQKLEMSEVEYLNKKRVKVPSWFLKFQGHDYENRIKAVFPALNKYTAEGQLQEELTVIIGKCYPFIPKDSELLIEEIINANNN